MIDSKLSDSFMEKQAAQTVDDNSSINSTPIIDDENDLTDMEFRASLEEESVFNVLSENDSSNASLGFVDEQNNSDDIKFRASSDEERLFINLPKNNSGNASSASIETDSADRVYAEMAKADHEVLNKMLLNELNPELQYNETQKRIFKVRLMDYIFRTLKVQLGFFLCIVSLFIMAVCVKIPFFNELSVELIDSVSVFLRFYIVSIIAEFIAMLFFIVKFVFDKSIVGLIMQIFKTKKAQCQ